MQDFKLYVQTREVAKRASALRCTKKKNRPFTFLHSVLVDSHSAIENSSYLELIEME